MARLLMISGDRSLAEGKHGAFYNTLEESHKYWDRIDVICPKVGEQKIKEVFGNVFIHSSPWPLLFQTKFIYRKGKEIFKNHKFDLMTVHEYPPFYNGIGACLLWHRIKVPYILEIFHIPGFPKASNLKESFYRLLMQLFIRFDIKRAKSVRVMNNRVGEFLIKYGASKEKINLIPAIYIDSDIFKPMDLPKEYDLIFVGRLEPNKGAGLFLEAVKKLNCKAIIVGNGSLYNKIKSEIENWKQPSKAEQWPIWPLNIIMHGFAKDSREIAELLNKSKILVMTSYNEGGPRVVVEALACGVPILATPVGIVPDLLKNGSGGEIIAWDAEDIANKARGLLGDLSRYNKFSSEAVEMAKPFDKKSAIKNYADKLKALI